MTAAAAPTLRITEVFLSLQGESRFAGLPCSFVRLTGCALRCTWCDSAYAFHGGAERTVDDVVAEVVAMNVPLVEITGGEPLEQEAFHALAAALLARGKTVLVETGGHVPLDGVDPRIVKVVDVKCPGSKMERHNHLPNLDLLGAQDEAKFVIADRADFDWALARVTERDLDARCGVLFSPVFEGASSPVAPRLAEWVRDSGRRIRLNLQVHKLLWGDVPGR